MAGGGEGMRGSRELDQTPTWAVSLVCAVIIVISLLLEKFIHLVGKTFSNRKKFGLLEALEKIKAELMVVGFISLTLTFGQNYITRICVPEKIGDTMLPCEARRRGHHGPNHGHHRHIHEHQRRLLWYEHRMLAAEKLSECARGYVPLISMDGLHQLHIFIFFLAAFHVMNSAVTMTLGRMKIREWKEWEKECQNEYTKNASSSYRLTHETSFVKGHASSWTTNPILFYTACFFRHMFSSVHKTDYLTLRHGFVSVHLAPGTRFDFQKYIKRSLEDDFKVVVGIPPLLWFAAVFYMLMNVNGVSGSVAIFWLSIMPLLTILAVGTKLQSIISRMAIEIKERHSMVQGIPLVEVSDKHFWFNWPKLMLHLIHLTLFQNAFEITYFFWITYEYGLYSCFHSYFHLSLFRVFVGIAVNIMCSYMTLPLYALVTQMGSHMKRAIFDDQTSKAIMSWHKKVKKNKDRSNHHSQRSEDSVKQYQASSEAGDGDGDGEGSVSHHHLRTGAAESSVDSTTPELTAKVNIAGDNTGPGRDQSGENEVRVEKHVTFA